jgi:hypothetical protein
VTRKTTIVILALIALATMVAGGSAVTPVGSASNEHSSGNQLTGTWIVNVDLPAPQTDVTSLQLYTDDGAFMESGNDSMARSPQYGSWERIGGRVYAASGTFFRFNAQTGAQIGSTKINRTIQLSSDGQSFTVVSRATFLDLSGNVVASFPGSATGERMPIERLPSQP